MPDYRETVEKLLRALTHESAYTSPHARMADKGLKLQEACQDALALLTEQDAELATCVEVRNSYQEAWQRIGSALVKDGFEDDTTEAAVMSALAELATLRAENARWRKARTTEIDCPCTDYHVAPYCPIHGG